jgi:hypothetical protein
MKARSEAFATLGAMFRRLSPFRPSQRRFVAVATRRGVRGVDDGPRKWIRSSYCESSACIEFTMVNNTEVGIRDSKDSVNSLVLQFSIDGWGAFVEAIRTGRLAPRF